MNYLDPDTRRARRRARYQATGATGCFAKVIAWMVLLVIGMALGFTITWLFLAIADLVT